MRKFKSFIITVLVITLSVFYVTPGIGAEITKTQKEMPVTSIILKTIDIYLDGQKAPLHYTAFVAANQRSVISLNDCSLIFGAQIAVIDTRLLLRKDSQEFILEEDDYWHFSPAQVQEENLTDINLDEFYLPLRFVAEQLGYKIHYNSAASAIILRSQDYEGPDPQFAPPEPPQLPTNLPRWGILANVPAMLELWPTENIIAGYYTSIATSPAPRNHNILLSCNKLNGVIVNPGEIFSFNQTVGQRTAQLGYKSANVIVGKRFVPGIGGGICQTSSTLYNSLLESQLQIVERHPHSLRIDYVPANRDATVSWGGADLKFRNNKPYPIKILAQVCQTYVICAIAAVE